MPVEINNELYYSVGEALKYLGITRDTLYRRIREGKLPKYEQGVRKRVYFRQADLDALKEVRRIDAQDNSEESNTN